MADTPNDMIHKLNICNRHNGTITGVIDVRSFDEQEVLLETSQGMLSVKGSEMIVKRLDLLKGEVDISGNFNSMIYSEAKAHGRNRGDSFLKQLFK